MIETIASSNDFLRAALPFYPNLKEEMLRLAADKNYWETGELQGLTSRDRTAERKIRVQKIIDSIALEILLSFH
jgi:hypothetical protein